MDLLQVDRQTCNQDGICSAVCPARLISMQEGGCPTSVVGAEEMCIGCGHCVAVCPTGSISHRDIPVGQCSPVGENVEWTAANCEHILRSRRSIRVFEDRPVSRTDILRLIEIARYSPSAHNCQCAEWLVLDNRDELRKLAGIVADWMRWVIGNMPEVALAWHMDKTLKRWEEGNDIALFPGAPVAIIAHAAEDNPLALSTCTIALTYLDLAATSMGLGSCWAGYFHVAATSFPPMKEALSLPAGHQCFGAMMVGYPEYGYHRFPMRKSPVIAWR